MEDVVTDQQTLTRKPWQAPFSAEELETYELYRRPGRRPFPWAASALLVIDVTEEFLGPRVPTIEAARQIRTACGIPAWDALGPIAALEAAFRERGQPVIFTKAMLGFGGAAIGDSAGDETSRIVRDIAPIEAEVVIAKPRASAFFATPLLPHLVRSGIRGLVVTGGTTSGCVRASTIEGSSLGLDMVIAHDGCFDRSSLSHAVALQELDVKYATVMDAGSVIDALTSTSAELATART